MKYKVNKVFIILLIFFLFDTSNKYQQMETQNHQNSGEQPIKEQKGHVNFPFKKTIVFTNESKEDHDMLEQESNKQPVKKKIRKQRGHYNAKTIIGFQRANWEKAVRNKQQKITRYYKGQSVPYLVSLSHFKMYGPGIYLFFKFLKELTILFLIMSIISLMPMIYNAVQGTLLQDAAGTFQIYIAILSIGNQKGAQVGNDGSFTSTAQQISASDKNKLFLAIPDVIYSLVFLAFYFYWSWRNEKLTAEVKEQVKLMNYKTVELLEFPENATEQQIKKHMEKFGKINQISTVKNYADMIYLAKKIHQLLLELKQLKLENKQAESSQAFKKKQEQIYQLYQQLQQEQARLELKTIKYYIVFQNPAQRQLLLQSYQPYQGLRSKFFCCREEIPPQLLLNGEQITVSSCNQQPTGIIWENIHIGWKQRWWRHSLQITVIILVLIAAFLFISLLNVSSPPMYNTSLDTSSYNEGNILSARPQVRQTWCLKQDSSVIFTDVNVTNLCSDVQSKYYYRVLFVSISISLVVVLVRFIARRIVVSMAKFKRYSTHSEQSNSLITNLFFCYVCTTVLITILVLRTSAFGVSFKNFLGVFIPSSNSAVHNNIDALIDYYDFTSGWYVDIGFQLWLNWLFLAFSPHCYWPFVSYGYEKFGQYMGKKQLVQKNMENWIEAEQFDIQDHYANILMVVWVGFAYSGGIPILLPLSLLALITKYWSHKYSFIRYSRIPKAFDESLNTGIINFLPFCLWSHFAISIWMYGVPDLFAYQSSWVDSTIVEAGSSFYTNFLQVANKISTTWWYFLIWVICAGIVLLKNVIYDFIMKRFFQQRGKAPTIVCNEQSSQIRSQRTLTQSYQLQNNPDYFEIMAILNPKRIQTKILKAKSQFAKHKLLLSSIEYDQYAIRKSNENMEQQLAT